MTRSLKRNHKNLYMKQLILLLNLCVLISCTGQTKPIGEGSLNLESFKFSTKITDLFPEKYKSEDQGNYYEIPGSHHSQIVVRDTTFIDKYTPKSKPVGLEYRQQSSTSIDNLAFFGDQIFNKINIATTLDGKIKVVNGVADEITKKQNSDLIIILNKKYGDAKKFKPQWSDGFSGYEWVTKNKIIRYVIAYDNESTTLKINVDQEKNTISSGEKEPHFAAYLFIINPNLKNEIFGKLNTGDFVYIH